MCLASHLRSQNWKGGGRKGRERGGLEVRTPPAPPAARVERRVVLWEVPRLLGREDNVEMTRGVGVSVVRQCWRECLWSQRLVAVMSSSLPSVSSAWMDGWMDCAVFLRISP